jgi:hypothetical protein
MPPRTAMDNDARRAPLAGRPRLHPYSDTDPLDPTLLVDKASFERFHENKWSGASFLQRTDGEIVLDMSPASSPGGTPCSSPARSPASSRRPTSEEMYVSPELQLISDLRR